MVFFLCVSLELLVQWFCLPVCCSWHLYSVLQALDFHHLSPFHSASLHANYAAQLESVGLWQWAIFPLLHIHDTRQ